MMVYLFWRVKKDDIKNYGKYLSEKVVCID